MELQNLFAIGDKYLTAEEIAERDRKLLIAQWEAEYEIETDPFAEMNGVADPFAEFLSCPLAG